MIFLAALNGDLLNNMIPLVVITLSMSIPIVSIITERFQKRDRMRLIEKAIEHGANLEDLKLEDTDECSRPRLPYRNGMVCLAVGAALIIGHQVLQEQLIAANIEQLRLPMLLGGLIVGLVGVALLVNDRMNRARFDMPAK